MKIPVFFPCILLIACRVHAGLSEPCGNFIEKPFFETNTSGFIYFEEDETALINFCSAANFCSIQWLKNGQLLDPSQNFTDGRLVVKDGGRMLRFSPVRMSDQGKYTCVATNNAGSVRKTQDLKINRSTKCPSFTSEDHKSLDHDRLLNVGENYFEEWEISTNSKLMCQFGRVVSLNNTPVAVDCAPLHGECYKDSTKADTWYVVLNRTSMTEEDFGTYKFSACDMGYTCGCLTVEVNLSHNQTATLEVKSGMVVTVSCSILLVVLLCALIVPLIKLDVQLFVKDYLHKTEDDDGRCYDAYISYTWSDTDRLFVLHLKSHLEQRGYRVYVPEIDNLPGGCTALQLTQALQTSRRFVMVLSPEYIRANFTAFEVNIFIEAVTKYKDIIIPIEFQDVLLPNESAILRHILKVCQKVTWANIEWPLTENSEYGNGDDQRLLNSVIVENSSNSKTVMEKSFRMKGFKQLLVRLPPKPKRNRNNFYV